LNLETVDVEWADGVDPQTGHKYEIKSTAEEIGEKYPAEGRFRLWKDQHNSLTSSAGQLGAAYYVFIVSTKEAIKADSREVTEWVNDNGGWNKAGHDRRDSKQLKIPWSYVYDKA
jgi:hypothetical protein